MKNLQLRLTVLILFAASAAILLAADNSWLHKVPAADRARGNPYAGRPEAVSAGGNLFAQNCAQCHGVDAEGRHGRPSLRSERVAHSTDGELAWLLRNGSLRKGMPSWNILPEPERWQIIAYLRSLPRDNSADAAVPHP
ncbi:MAG: c-type cytochrome [Terracidiphilus sp.]|jgi:mono/diheme cytochrome c family protein